MKLFLISDNTDTLTGMRLAGIEGVVVHDEKSFADALSRARSDPDNGIILVTERLSHDYPQVSGPAREQNGIPLVIAIPDRHGSTRTPHFITDYVSEAVGLSVDTKS